MMARQFHQPPVETEAIREHRARLTDQNIARTIAGFSAGTQDALRQAGVTIPAIELPPPGPTPEEKKAADADRLAALFRKEAAALQIGPHQCSREYQPHDRER